MKHLEYHDSRGYKQRSLVRDTDTDPTIGIPQELPDIESLDWETIKRDLHAKLLDRQLLELSDIQQRQADFIWCITAALKKPLMRLYQKRSD